MLDMRIGIDRQRHELTKLIEEARYEIKRTEWDEFFIADYLVHNGVVVLPSGAMAEKNILSECECLLADLRSCVDRGDGNVIMLHNAANFLEILLAAANPWNDAKTNPPKKSGEYLACMDGGITFVAAYRAESEKWYLLTQTENQECVRTVTHWARRPSPPGVEK